MIKDETNNRIEEDKKLDNKIKDETQARKDADAAESEARKNADNALKDKISAESEARKEADAAESEARKNADKKLGNKIKDEAQTRAEEDIKIREEFAKADAAINNRIDGVEQRIDNLDDKLNKGLSLMAAMNAVDFQDVNEGEMAIGAGFGHYGNAQSVAIGVAYSPVENLHVNAKYSVTAGDVDSFAVGVGASYKFRVK